MRYSICATPIWNWTVLEKLERGWRKGCVGTCKAKGRKQRIEAKPGNGN